MRNLIRIGIGFLGLFLVVAVGGISIYNPPTPPMLKDSGPCKFAVRETEEGKEYFHDWCGWCRERESDAPILYISPSHWTAPGTTYLFKVDRTVTIHTFSQEEFEKVKPGS